MRKTCLDMVQTLSRENDAVVFIGSDLSPGLLDDMKSEKPDHHYMEGVSEAHVIGMAAGMAMDGFLPYVNTIATFITRRCFEQVAVDLCLHNLPVRLIGNGGGVVYAPLGPTHLAIEDIALFRALPNMAIVAVSDAEEMKRLMPATLDWPGPLYIRLGKGGDRVISQPDDDFRIGRAIVRQKEQNAFEVLLISTGIMTTRTLDAIDLLESQGIGCRLLHMHTIKPLDTAAIQQNMKGASLMVTVEEHVRTGGLGSAVAETLIDSLQPHPPLLRLALPDQFPEDYGRQENLLDSAGLDPQGIATAVQAALQPFRVSTAGASSEVSV